MRRRITDGLGPVYTAIDAVAELTDRDPTELEPFGEHFDTDALESLFSQSSSHDTVQVTLSYEGCRVTLESDVVEVEPVPVANSLN